MKKKSLGELLSEYAVKAETDVAARKQAAFLARWDEIEEYHRKGWSYINIWRALFEGGEFDLSYASFNHYMRKRRLRERQAQNRARNQASTSPATLNPPVQSVAKPPLTPGATRVDMPVFGQDVKPREPRKF
ncbi:MAG: TraK family protein [Planctomycetaceae bacterium]|nr:TraK family protein [Planctomycetaceae bacterium]